MFMFNFWGGEGRGGDADICKYTRIRRMYYRFRNRNQPSTEQTEFAIYSLLQKIAFIRKLRLRNLGIMKGIVVVHYHASLNGVDCGPTGR